MAKGENMKPAVAKPIIGVIICGFLDNKQFVTNTYIQSIRYSGGLPIVLPLVRSDDILSHYLTLCDGFLFCGGNDITPLLFGQEPRQGIGRTNITLDLFQIRLMKGVLKKEKPLLAICRGMQVLNAACKGTIYQDIHHQTGQPFNHMQLSDSRSDVSHPILVESNSKLSKYLGKHLYVNSFHHQSIDSVGENLTVSARASDHTIEAIEHTSHPFVIGVQWHPECMYRTSPEMRALFRGFITSTKKGGNQH